MAEWPKGVGKSEDAIPPDANVRVCSSRALIQGIKLIEEKKIGWDAMDWESLEVVQGPGEGASSEWVRIQSNHPPWREMFDAQRKGLGKNYCNVEIYGVDGYVPCHHVFLLNVSELLDALIKERIDSGRPLNHADVLTITLDGVKVDHIRAVLSLLYTGSVQIQLESEKEFRQAMKMLQIKKVKFEKLHPGSVLIPKKFRQVLLIRLKEMGDENDSVEDGQGGGSLERQSSLVGAVVPPPQPQASTSRGTGLLKALEELIPPVQKVKPIDLVQKKEKARIQRKLPDEEENNDDDEEEKEQSPEEMDEDEEDSDVKNKFKKGGKYERDNAYVPPGKIHEKTSEEEMEEDDDEEEEENTPVTSSEAEETEEEEVKITRSRTRAKGSRLRSKTSNKSQSPAAETEGRYPRRKINRSRSSGSSPAKKTPPKKGRRASLRGKSQEDHHDSNQSEKEEEESPPVKRATRSKAQSSRARAAVGVTGENGNEEKSSSRMVISSSDDEEIDVEGSDEECGVCHSKFGNIKLLERHLKTKCGKSFQDYYDISKKFCLGCQCSFREYSNCEFINHVGTCVKVNHKKSRPSRRRIEDEDDEVEVVNKVAVDDSQASVDVVTLREYQVQVDNLPDEFIAKLLSMVQEGKSVHLTRPPGFNYTFPVGHSKTQQVVVVETVQKKAVGPARKRKPGPKRRGRKAGGQKRKMSSPMSSSSSIVAEPPTKKKAAPLVESEDEKMEVEVEAPPPQVEVEVEKEKEVENVTEMEVENVNEKEKTDSEGSTPSPPSPAAPASDPEDEELQLPSPPPVRAPPRPQTLYGAAVISKTEGQRLKESLKTRLGHVTKTPSVEAPAPTPKQNTINFSGPKSKRPGPKSKKPGPKSRKPGPKSKTQVVETPTTCTTLQQAPPMVVSSPQHSSVPKAPEEGEVEEVVAQVAPPLIAVENEAVSAPPRVEAVPEALPTSTVSENEVSSSSSSPPSGGLIIPQILIVPPPATQNEALAASAPVTPNQNEAVAASALPPNQNETVAASNPAPPTQNEAVAASALPPNQNEALTASAAPLLASEAAVKELISQNMTSRQETASVSSYSGPISSTRVLAGNNTTTISLRPPSQSLPIVPGIGSRHGVALGVPTAASQPPPMMSRPPLPRLLRAPNIGATVQQSSPATAARAPQQAPVSNALAIQRVNAPMPPYFARHHPEVRNPAPPPPNVQVAQRQGAPPALIVGSGISVAPVQQIRGYRQPNILGKAPQQVSLLHQNQVVASSTSLATMVRNQPQQQLPRAAATNNNNPPGANNGPTVRAFLNMGGPRQPAQPVLQPQQQQQPQQQVSVRNPVARPPRPTSNPQPARQISGAVSTPQRNLTPPPTLPSSQHMFMGSRAYNGSVYHVYTRPTDAPAHPNVSMTYPLDSPAAQDITSRLNTTTSPNAVTVRLPVTGIMNPLGATRAQMMHPQQQRPPNPMQQAVATGTRSLPQFPAASSQPPQPKTNAAPNPGRVTCPVCHLGFATVAGLQSHEDEGLC